MQLLGSPKKLLLFWYPESLIVWLRVWKNSMLYLEEDLAVSLMWRLLFVPLFHDTTIVGRILSFFFRLTRILLGLSALLLVTLLLVTFSLIWLSLPVLAMFVAGDLGLIFKGLLFSGFVLFFYHYLSHPPKKLWQTKSYLEIWDASLLKAADLKVEKLMKSYKGIQLCQYLELKGEELEIGNWKLEVGEVLEKTWSLGRKLGVAYLGPEHFLASFLLSANLNKLGKTEEDLAETLRFFKLKEDSWRIFWIWDEDFTVKHLKGVNRGWLSVPTPILDEYSIDLTKEASRSNFTEFSGRADKLVQVINHLSLQKGSNICLVGEVGVGKTTLVNFLAKLIVLGDAPASLISKRLVKIETTKILSGIKDIGEIAERLKQLFAEVERSGNIILFVTAIENLNEIYPLLVPYIESNLNQFIITTTPDGYSKVVQQDENFNHLFYKVELEPASVKESLEIIEKAAIDLERNHQKVKVTFLAMKKIVELADRYFKESVLPQSALKLLQEAVVRQENGWVTANIIQSIVKEDTGIPIQNQPTQILTLESRMKQSLIGQDLAITRIVNSLKRAQTDLREVSRPLASFLFVGPTGVGKTETARVLAKEYFQENGQFLQFNMSEFSSFDGLVKLIGADGDVGQLSEKVKTNPYSLILLDEFEKASIEVRNLFLQILEEGQVTDGLAKVVDFTNTLIIATSNIGALLIIDCLSQGIEEEQIELGVKQEILKVLSPELVNRFDGMVVFKPLTLEEMAQISKNKLQKLQQSLRQKGYLVEFTDKLTEELAKKGFSPEFGARPLRALIQDQLETKISDLILEEKLQKGEKFTVSSLDPSATLRVNTERSRSIDSSAKLP